MSQRKLLGAIALLALLTGGAARADHRHGYQPDYQSGYDQPGYYQPHDYHSRPQIRLGIDVLWGGYGYSPAPPVAWYPVQYVPAPVYYGPPGYYRGHGHGHGKHHHRQYDRDRCDD